MKQLETLKKMSPTSLKVTFQQVERGAHLTLQECLTMEHRIVKRIYKGHDFTEGLFEGHHAGNTQLISLTRVICTIDVPL